jgi:glycerophosphoryl diester phosphodiesterase
MKKKILIYTVCALVTVILYLLSPFIPAFFYSEQYATTNTDHMIIIGHRGGAALAPENTLACYRKGIEAGADMIEIDIHLTRDGHVVVCHDQSVDRTTNGKGLIRELTLNEIRQLHIVDRNGNQTNERIPTLEEVFQLFQEVRSNGNPCQLLIEIKRTRNIYQGLEEKLLEQIYQNKASNWVTVQ